MKKRLISTCILIAYCVILVKVMVFKDVPLIRVGHLMLNFGGIQADRPANFIPFKTILPYFLGDKGLIIGGLNLVGNIALLVPLGFLVPFVYRNITWKKSLALAVASGFIIEGMQVVLRVGIFDIDDVILNALGFMVGYWAFVILAKWVRSGNYRSIITAAIILGIATAAVFYFVYSDLQQAMNSGVEARRVQLNPESNEQEAEVQQGEDLCGGTGGTGEIIDQGDNTITIKRQDGVIEVINLTADTDIRSSTGPISQSDLKIGDHVTLVVYENKTATAVFVCNATDP